MLVKVFIIDFYSAYGPGSPKPSHSIFLSFLTVSVRNSPSVNFGTNVPCIRGGNRVEILRHKIGCKPATEGLSEWRKRGGGLRITLPQSWQRKKISSNGVGEFVLKIKWFKLIC